MNPYPESYKVGYCEDWLLFLRVLVQYMLGRSYVVIKVCGVIIVDNSNFVVHTYSGQWMLWSDCLHQAETLRSHGP